MVRCLYEEAVNERKFELLTELIAPDYVGPRGERGPEGFADTVKGLVAGASDIRFEILDLVSSPDAAAIRWQWTGTHSGTLFNLPPSHKQLTNTGLAIYHFADEKIVRASRETDRLGVLQQIGIVPENVGARPAVER